MNFCTKCSSYYQNPGTCNCYALVLRTGHTDTNPVFPEPVTRPTIPFPGNGTGDAIPDPYRTTCGSLEVLLG